MASVAIFHLSAPKNKISPFCAEVRSKIALIFSSFKNLAIGLCTPPVGNALFIGCAVGKRRLEDVVKQMLPLYGVMLAGLMLVTYVPFITSWLPTLLGYLN